MKILQSFLCKQTMKIGFQFQKAEPKPHLTLQISPCSFLYNIKSQFSHIINHISLRTEYLYCNSLNFFLISLHYSLQFMWLGFLCLALICSSSYLFLESGPETWALCKLQIGLFRNTEVLPLPPTLHLPNVIRKINIQTLR